MTISEAPLRSPFVSPLPLLICRVSIFPEHERSRTTIRPRPILLLVSGVWTRILGARRPSLGGRPPLTARPPEPLPDARGARLLLSPHTPHPPSTGWGTSLSALGLASTVFPESEVQLRPPTLSGWLSLFSSSVLLPRGSGSRPFLLRFVWSLEWKGFPEAHPGAGPPSVLPGSREGAGHGKRALPGRELKHPFCCIDFVASRSRT